VPIPSGAKSLDEKPSRPRDSSRLVCWSNDYVMCGQRFEGVFENRTRQVGAVAVEGDNASLMTFVKWRTLK